MCRAYICPSQVAEAWPKRSGMPVTQTNNSPKEARCVCMCVSPSSMSICLEVLSARCAKRAAGTLESDVQQAPTHRHIVCHVREGITWPITLGCYFASARSHGRRARARARVARSPPLRARCSRSRSQSEGPPSLSVRCAGPHTRCRSPIRARTPSAERPCPLRYPFWVSSPNS